MKQTKKPHHFTFIKVSTKLACVMLFSGYSGLFQEVPDAQCSPCAWPQYCSSRKLHHPVVLSKGASILQECSIALRCWGALHICCAQAFFVTVDGEVLYDGIFICV